MLRFPLYALLISMLIACATTGGKGAASTRSDGPVAKILPAPAGITCPAAIDEAGFARLAPACKGRLALALSRKSADAHAWAEALRWARIAREHLEPAMKALANFQEAEARYAQGITGGTEALFRSALDSYQGTREAGEIHYYLAEIALARKDTAGALVELAEALASSSGAPWQQAAESLLISTALEHEGALTVDLPGGLQTLPRYLEAERNLRDGKYAAALQAFRSLSGDAELQRLGLDDSVALRVQELESRGASEAGKFGVVLPLTGRAAPFGQYALRGILLAANPFQDAEITLAIENDRGEPFRSVRAMRSVAKRGAVAVIGPMIGKSAEAGVTAAHALGMPTVVLSGAGLPPLAPWAVRMAVTPEQQVQALLTETMNARGFKRFSILYPDDTFGLTMRDAFWNAVLAQGGEITGVQSYEPASTDFRHSIRAIVGADEFTPEELRQRKAANQPLAHLDFDGIFIPDGGRTVGLILPQLLYFDVRGPVFLGPSTWNDPRLIEMGREYAEGTLFVDWFWLGADNEETKYLLSLYEKAYGDTRPPSVTAQGFEAAQMLAAVARQGSREAVRDAMLSYSWQSFSGRAKVGPDGEVDRPLTYLTVEGKQIVPVKRTGF